MEQTILIVDDEPLNIEVLGEVLKLRYRRIVALKGEKALELATSSKRPDLILLDIVMPGMDGYEVCRRLKSDPQTREIPVIFVTGRTQEQERIKGLELGAVDFICKPISPEEVLEKVQRHLPGG